MLVRKISTPKVYAAIVFISILIVWEAGSGAGLISTSFFPPPTKIWASIVKLVNNGALVSAVSVTFLRFFVGLICGAFIGALVGLVMGWSPNLYAFLSPYIAAFYPIPKIAIFPLLMIIFGIGEGSKFAAIFLASFFPMLVTSLAGVQQINNIYFEVGKNYGVRNWKVFTHILFPGSLPSMLAGLRLAANTSFIIAISVEIISSTSGLGVLLWFAWQTFRVSELYAVLVVISLLGIIINFLFEQMSTYLIPWLGE